MLHRTKRVPLCPLKIYNPGKPLRKYLQTPSQHFDIISSIDRPLPQTGSSDDWHTLEVLLHPQ
jgi:hypothetical protein